MVYCDGPDIIGVLLLTAARDKINSFLDSGERDSSLSFVMLIFDQFLSAVYESPGLSKF